MKRRYIISTVLIILIAVVVYSTYGTNNTEVAEQSKNDKKYVLNFTLEDLDGKQVDFNTYKGKVVLIDVWDTWCPPCRRGIPDLVELYSEYKDEGLVIIGAALGREGKNAVTDFMSDYKINYPVLKFDAKLLKILGSFEGIPTMFIIDKEGKLYKQHTGLLPKSALESDIKKLLKIKAS